jgi:hypothetical protein
MGGEILRQGIAERFCFGEQVAEFFLVRPIEGNKKFIELGDGFAVVCIGALQPFDLVPQPLDLGIPCRDADVRAVRT